MIKPHSVRSDMFIVFKIKCRVAQLRGAERILASPLNLDSAPLNCAGGLGTSVL